MAMGAGRILFYFGRLGIGFTEVGTFEQGLHQAQGVSLWISGRRVRQRGTKALACCAAAKSPGWLSGRQMGEEAREVEGPSSRRPWRLCLELGLALSE